MRFLAAILLFPIITGGMAQNQVRESSAFSLDDVLKLVRAGKSESLVIAEIKSHNRHFDLNADEIAELQRKGVSETIIRFLIDPSQPYNPPPPPPPPPAPKPPPPPLKDPLMPKIPGDPGLYWLSKSEPGAEAFQFIELKAVAPLKSGRGGKLGKMIPLKGGHTRGFIVPAEAKVRIPPGASVFYVRPGAKIGIEEIVLLKMTPEQNRRVIDFGPKPDKPEFSPDEVLPYEPTPLSEGLYRINLAPMKPGEFIFLLRGSGDPNKGLLGKGYDFGVAAR
jgi:hypothetical protein